MLSTTTATLLLLSVPAKGYTNQLSQTSEGFHGVVLINMESEVVQLFGGTAGNQLTTLVGKLTAFIFASHID